MPPTSLGRKFTPVEGRVLADIAETLVMESHGKTRAVNATGANGPKFCQTPIGPGGKVDDTSCVVAQVLEYSDVKGREWLQKQNRRWWQKLFSFPFAACGSD